MAAFSAPDRVQSTAVHLAMAALSPPERESDHAPYALSSPGGMEAALAAAGLPVAAQGEVECVWRYQTAADAVRALIGSAGGTRAVQRRPARRPRRHLLGADPVHRPGRRHDRHAERLPLGHSLAPRLLDRTAMTRVAAVTGGAGAIGGGIVAGLRAAGHEVAIFDLNGTAVVDLASRAAVQAGAAAVLDRYGRCDVLVHAAAAFDRASLLDLDPEVWHRVQAVNVESALWLAQAVVPGMAERGFGRIVFVVSDTVWDPRLVTCSRTWPARPP